MHQKEVIKTKGFSENSREHVEVKNKTVLVKLQALKMSFWAGVYFMN